LASPKTLTCASCGNEEPEGSVFCGRCGAPFAPADQQPADTAPTDASTPTGVMDPASTDAPTEVAPPTAWPQAPSDPAPPPPAAAAPPDSASATRPPWAAETRPRWLLPVIAIIALVAIAVVIAVIVLSRDTGSGGFTRKANELVTPVAASDRLLDATLQAVDRPADLGDVAEAASRLTRDLTLAAGGLTILDAGGDDLQVKALLGQALTANLSYAEKVKTAADGLNPVRASAAATAGQQAAQSYSAVGSAAPKLALPQTGVFLSAGQLQALAADQVKQAQAKATSTAALRSYVRSIDSLLRNSADTRANLASLIAGIRNGQVSPSQATSEIASTINQRQDLQNQVSAVPTPAPFRNAAVKLRDSIKVSLDDDYAIQGWINAWFDGDSYAFERAFARHETATARASAAKADFLALYNRLRGRFLKLPPLRVSY
jgi:hypothetical protein